MIDIKLVRKNFPQVMKMMEQRRDHLLLEKLTQLKEFDEKYLLLLKEIELLVSEKKKEEQRLISLIKQKEISSLIDCLKKQLEKKASVISSKRKEFSNFKKKVEFLLEEIPNFPNFTFEGEKKIVLRQWGKKKKFSLSHIRIGEKLGFLSFSISRQLAGSRFVVYQQQGALLVRKLIDMMLFFHRFHGYQEYLFPLLNNRDTFFCSGHLFKFSDQLFKVEDSNFFLIPTAEVPLVSVFRGSILNKKQLPVKLCAYTPCFRREAGAAGKKTKGLLRMHQFHKVEVFQIVEPESADLALDKMTKHCEKLLRILKIPYRVVLLPPWEIGFSASKTYDLEVWFPSLGKYIEVSSLSNCTDFQSRRVKLRVNNKQVSEKNSKNYPPSMLNGSGLAIDRLLAVFLETHFSLKKNSLIIPSTLKDFYQKHFKNLVSWEIFEKN